MILGVHGDTCRLGYLKVVACLLEDGSPRSPDYLSSLLLETVKSAENDVDKILGLLRTEVNAINYVRLASQLGFYNRSTGRLGEFGAAYVCTSSPTPIREHITGQRTIKLSQILQLSPIEKLLFLHAVMSKDFPMVTNIIKWVAAKREFSRQEAMVTIMEEVYPEALRRALKKETGKRRQLLLKELESSSGFREERLKYASKVEWIKSRLYAKYRHTVPPRLEWLSDIGLLIKPGRGRYAVAEKSSKLLQELEVVMQRPLEKLDQTFFTSFVHSVVPLKNGGQQVESQALTETYRVLQRAFEKVRLDVLCLATTYKMLDMGYRSTPASASRTFSYLSLLYSDRVFATYSEDGSPEVTGLDIQLME